MTFYEYQHIRRMSKVNSVKQYVLVKYIFNKNTFSLFKKYRHLGVVANPLLALFSFGTLLQRTGLSCCFMSRNILKASFLVLINCPRGRLLSQGEWYIELGILGFEIKAVAKLNEQGAPRVEFVNTNSATVEKYFNIIFPNTRTEIRDLSQQLVDGRMKLTLRFIDVRSAYVLAMRNRMQLSGFDAFVDLASNYYFLNKITLYIRSVCVEST